jgi:hypothetical protein
MPVSDLRRLWPAEEPIVFILVAFRGLRLVLQPPMGPSLVASSESKLGYQHGVGIRFARTTVIHHS